MGESEINVVPVPTAPSHLCSPVLQRTEATTKDTVVSSPGWVFLCLVLDVPTQGQATATPTHGKQLGVGVLPTGGYEGMTGPLTFPVFPKETYTNISPAFTRLI